MPSRRTMATGSRGASVVLPSKAAAPASARETSCSDSVTARVYLPWDSASSSSRTRLRSATGQSASKLNDGATSGSGGESGGGGVMARRGAGGGSLIGGSLAGGRDDSSSSLETARAAASPTSSSGNSESRNVPLW